MITIDFQSRIPVYEQIEEQVIWLINSGVYEPNFKLPSLRALSGELKLNINTVKRAFQELEVKGVVYSVQGKGIFVSPLYKGNENLKAEAIENLRVSVRSARAKGVTQKEIQSVVDEIYCLKQVK
ncbi:MAG: GntR family transcriptional regulator [Clostridia bacterium]|nr:GntR family transcriptional regulator [Clostridia bacterium]